MTAKKRPVKSVTDRLPKPQSEYGYTEKEIYELCKELKINLRKFWKAFGVNTSTLIDGQVRYYVCDVERALFRLGNKLGKNHSWD